MSDGCLETGSPIRNAGEAENTVKGLIGFTVPKTPWVLMLPGDGVTVREQRITPDGGSGYFFLTDDTNGINISFFIEPAQNCKSSQECRDMVQKAGFAHLGKAENIVPSEIGDVSVVECFVPEFKGIAVKQQNLFAEFVVQGYWVDLHISKVQYAKADHERFEQLVKGITFVPKGKGE